MPHWLVLGYVPTSLFSLKVSTATNAAAKTCFVPTPYAIKLALVDAEIRRAGLQAGRSLFDLVRALDVRVEPPPRLVVTNSLIKIAVIWESKGKASERAAAIAKAKQEGEYPFKPTIAFREFVFYDGPIRIAFNVAGIESPIEARLRDAARHVAYFGKRGSFFRPANEASEVAELPLSFMFPADAAPDPSPIEVLYQVLDDTSPQASFDDVSSYTPVPKGRRGEFRIQRLYALPLRRTRSSRTFTAYERTGHT